jgi:hypothetical protein
VIEWRESGVEPPVMIKNRASAVYINGCSGLVGDSRKKDIFAVKMAVAITKRMHAEM